MFPKTRYLRSTIICLIVFANCFAVSTSSFKGDQILVRFAPKSNGSIRTQAEHNQILSIVNAGQVKREFKRVSGLTVVKIPQGKTVSDVLNRLSGRKEILFAEPDYIVHATQTPNDTYYSQLWAMPKISAPSAWNIETGANVIVAVIDSGVDYTHPDLAANMWSDANGNHGYNAVYDNFDPMDDYFHGTHVAGIIGAVGNNATGVTGVCWNVKIMACKFINSSDEGNVSDAITCIEYAIDNGAKILNNSWGGPSYSEALKDEVDETNNAGVLFIASAGNYGGYTSWHDNDAPQQGVYPGSYDCNNIICVMATDIYDGVPTYSHYGLTTVDLAAPGGDTTHGDPCGIFSTFPTYLTDAMAYNYYSTNYQTLEGTSMATPYVSGACALLLGINPSLSPPQVKSIIMQSVDHLDSLTTPQQLCVSGGRLNIYNALLHCSPLSVSKTDNAPGGGIGFNSRLTYTIDYNYANTNPTWTKTLHNVTLTDYLPPEILHTNVTPSGSGSYNSAAHTVTWNLGTLSPGHGGSVTVAVTVGNTSPTAEYIANTVSLTCTEGNSVSAVRNTPWCYKVFNNSKSKWYSTINSAVTDSNDGDVITLYPGSYGETLDLGSRRLTLQGSNPADRSVVARTAILTSFISDSYTGIPAISISGSSGIVLNGLTIIGDADAIESENSTLTIRNCIIQSGSGCSGISVNGGSADVNSCEISPMGYSDYGNAGIYQYYTTSNVSVSNSVINCQQVSYGIDCEIGTLTVKNCKIMNASVRGVSVDGASAFSVSNSIICGNYSGIWTGNFTASSQICDNMVYRNHDGIYLTSNVNGAPITVKNNTSVYNIGYGLLLQNSATVNNMILWGNGTPVNGNPAITYSCIQGTPLYSGVGNTNSDPGFVHADTNDFHLASGSSPCVDTGTGTGSGETDIDGDPRKIGTAVDMGADEFNPSFSPSGRVSLPDLARLAKYWNTSWVGMSFADLFDFENDNRLNFKNFKIFATHWLDVRSNLYTANNYTAFVESQDESVQSDSNQVSAMDANSPPPSYPPIYMACDTNMPEPNQVVTVWVKTSTPLFCMGLGVYVTGDANVTDAMKEADCNSYGWDNGWNSDPYIDPNGKYVYLGSVRWAADANGTVGYFKLQYYSGQVTAYFDQVNSLSFAWDSASDTCPSVPCSTDVMIWGRDPNEP
jgi:thermitase